MQQNVFQIVIQLLIGMAQLASHVCQFVQLAQLQPLVTLALKILHYNNHKKFVLEIAMLPIIGYYFNFNIKLI